LSRTSLAECSEIGVSGAEAKSTGERLKRKSARIRIGDYRVIYSIDDSARKIDIAIIRHRRDVYRGLCTLALPCH
jgi:mRNA-degrading endonuclease RelE of RelBE toxin-antitoxin system